MFRGHTMAVRTGSGVLGRKAAFGLDLIRDATKPGGRQTGQKGKQKTRRRAWEDQGVQGMVSYFSQNTSAPLTLLGSRPEI